MSACSASAVPMRTSTAGSSRRISSGVSTSRSRRSISGMMCVAVARERPGRLVDELGSVERGDERLDAARRARGGRRPNRLARHLLVLVAHERRAGDR